MRDQKAKTFGAVLLLLLTLSGCGLFKDDPINGVDSKDPRAQELFNRASEYWTKLAEGDAHSAFGFLTDFCKNDRQKFIAQSEPDILYYEQRWINRMAFTKKKSSEIVSSLSVKIGSVQSDNKEATASLESSIPDISMKNLKWYRDDRDNLWYLNSCKAPFKSPDEDIAQARIERQRDQTALRDGLITDNGISDPDQKDGSAGGKRNGNY